MKRQASQAQAMVEFALVGMAFFMMLFGTIEFGRLLWTNHELANGTREGARFAMVNGTLSGGEATQAQVEGIIQDRTAGIEPGRLTVTLDYVDDPEEYREVDTEADVGDRVIVSTSYEFDFISGMFLDFGPIQLGHTSEVIVQY